MNELGRGTLMNKAQCIELALLSGGLARAALEMFSETHTAFARLRFVDVIKSIKKIEDFLNSVDKITTKNKE